ncbi:MAG: ATP-binding protein, partial [Desulfobacterales bacterium]|nr:ATP-binding protein [Desulfobacterales bacterium]
MYKISTVIVEGFWKTKTIRASFSDSVNIFIGSNGTGKTTFMNLLQAIFSVDVPLLNIIPFTKVEFVLKRKSAIRKISLEKQQSNQGSSSFRYKIGRNVYKFSFHDDTDIRRRRIHPRLYNEIKECKKHISKVVSLSWLSVHRELIETDYEEHYYRQRPQVFRSPIDKRLDDLLERLTAYQLTLEREVNQYSKRYQTDVLAGLLYNKKFDTFIVKDELNMNPESIKEGLLNAYRDLNAINQKIESGIETHAKVISTSLKNLSDSLSDKEKAIELNDVLPIILLRRTNHIIELSKKLEKEKNRIFNPLNVYISQLKTFIPNKEFILTPGEAFPLKIIKDSEKIGIEELSSGEKQLFILFTETLLQMNKSAIFIADEPELSLHITWQRQLLKA